MEVGAMQKNKSVYIFWGGNLKMWKKWIRPTSPYIAQASLLITAVSGIIWLINTLDVIDIDTDIDVVSILFWVFLGLSILILLLVVPYERWENINGDNAELRIENPKNYIFPYIRTINAYRAYYNDESLLSISVFFPSALMNEQDFKIKGKLSINGYSFESNQYKDVSINADAVNRIYDWEFPINESISNLIKTNVKEGKPFKVSLHIEDFNNNKNYWDTEELTTLFLTKVN
jgi:hypothetical protein